jgi:spermidine synthase
LRRFFFLTAGCTGAAVLIVEILGAKILAPWFGTSHFVWTAQIAVTLISLACGYYLGGCWVDRSAKPGKLYAAIIGAGIYLAATTPFTESLAYACLNLRLALGSLVASVVLFFVPLTLLAMVGPYLIRVLTQSVDAVGGNVGRLSAVSTLGSVVGTALIGYVLIPLCRNSVTLIITALALIGLGVIYYVIWGRGGARAGAIAAFLLTLGIGWFGANQDRYNGKFTTELFRVNSNFGQLQVIQSTTMPFRALENDYLTQNTYDNVTHASRASFTYLLGGLARMYATNLDDVLCIGLGVGIVPMQFATNGSRVDVAEINPAVVPIAQRFFDFQPDKMNIFIEDGRCYLNRCTNRYDAVCLDAFLGDSPPSHLMTREAFASIRRVLKPGGTLVINSFASFDAGRDFLGQSLAKTLRDVFGSVRVFGVHGGNTMYVASARETLEPLRQPDVANIHPYCWEKTRDTFRSPIEPNPAIGIVLTDDFNPSEFYDAMNREELRRNNAVAVRDRL